MLEDKIQKHAEIVADANELKESDTVSDARQLEAAALEDLIDADTQYEVADVALPSERESPSDDGDDESGE